MTLTREDRAEVRAIVRDELASKLRRRHRCGTTGETMPPRGSNYPRCMGSAVYGSIGCTCGHESDDR